MKRYFYYSLLILLLTACNFKGKEADVVLHNATIYTANDPQPFANAIAIKDNRIIDLGAERDILNGYKAAEYIDCQGQYVFPGFIDAHCHFTRFGLGLSELDLVGTKSWEECLEKVKEHRKKYPNQQWLNGWGWDQNDWEVKEFPNRKELDKLFPDFPISLTRIDGHAAIVNKTALNLADITKDSFFEGGEILKFDNGEPTGLLIDNAMEYIRELQPEESIEEIKQALLKAQKECFRVGLTSVVDAGLSVREVDVIKSMHDSGELKMRVYAMLSPNDEALARMKEGPYQDDLLSVRSIKLYGDGALGSRGALLKKPYHDDHGNSGLMREAPEFYAQWAKYAKHYGFQLNTHCIGDGANSFILDLYASNLEGINDLRWRIEHAQVVDPIDMHYFKDYSIIPSVQPTHATSDMYWAEDRLGVERMEGAYSYQTLLKENGIIALGTDFPIESIDPLKTFFAAVFRQDVEGFPENGFRMEEALNPEETIKGMTLWAALANFEDTLKGSVEIGKLADFTVLNADLLNAKKDLMSQVKVTKTIIGGEVVWGN